MELAGRTLWLTGASSGIGAALAPRLAAAGVILALSARREAALEDVAAGATTGGVSPLVRPLDVTDLAAVQHVYADLKSAWGRVEIVFYNAGTWSRQSVASFDAAGAVSELDVNLLGMARVLGTAVPDMAANREGELIGMASLAGYAGLPRSAAYSASKAGANAFLQSLRIDLRPYGVGVTTVNPGYVATSLDGRRSLRQPFEQSADAAAARIVEGLLRGETEIHFPKRLSRPYKLLTALPFQLYEAFAPWFVKGP
jgi:short-subunit dehydrogenase